MPELIINEEMVLKQLNSLKIDKSPGPDELHPRFTGNCFIQKIYAPSSSLLQGKHLPFSPSPLRLNIFRLYVILSLTQLYRYTPEIFLFSTATFKYTYPPPLQTNWTRIVSERGLVKF